RASASSHRRETEPPVGTAWTAGQVTSALTCIYVAECRDLRPTHDRRGKTMRRPVALGMAVLMLGGCSLLGGDPRNEEIPPRPLSQELCDAIGTERIEKITPNAKTTQAKDITGMGASAGVVDASCDAMG